MESGSELSYCIDGKAILHEVTIKEPHLPSLAAVILENI
jgi:hypothetical protein